MKIGNNIEDVFMKTTEDMVVDEIEDYVTDGVRYRLQQFVSQKLGLGMYRIMPKFEDMSITLEEGLSLEENLEL